jgi:non-heme chloroperoxidase
VTHPVRAAELSTGVALSYVEQGDRAEPPVVLLHGFAESWRSFELVLGHLPSSVNALAVSQRGHGASDKPDAGYGLEDFSDDLGAFLEAVGIESAVIVGGSSGGYVAQRFAADHPHRTSALVLSGAPRSLRDKPGVAELLREVLELGDPIDPAYAREFIEGILVHPVPPGFLETLVEAAIEAPAPVWRETLRGLLDAVPPTDAATIDAPTLVLWGDRDAFLPRADQEGLVAAIPGARMVVYEDTGHVVHWERPERVAADIAAFAKA